MKRERCYCKQCKGKATTTKEGYVRFTPFYHALAKRLRNKLFPPATASPARRSTRNCSDA